MKKQNLSQRLRSLLMSRAFRCGGYSVLLTALIILLVLAVNHLAAILETILFHVCIKSCIFALIY